MNITVVTLYDPKCRSWAEPIAESKRRYCEKHGYKFVCHTDSLDKSRSPHYSKVPAILKCFDDPLCEWVFWSDADAMIVDPEVKLEQFIDPDYFMILSGDINGHTTSNFFIRHSEWARKLLNQWDAYRPEYQKSPYEQMILGFILNSQTWLLNRIKISGDAFNEHYLQRRHKFIVHLGGISNERRLKYVRQIMNPQLSYSQYGEDVFIAEHFKGRTGTFLEIGALDGVKDSNCRKLAELGWHGVCIEPNPHLFVRLMKNYKAYDVATICALVTGDNGIRTLHLNQDGLSTTNPDVFGDLSKHPDVHFYGSCFAPSITPNDISKVFGNHFDFVSIDAEGMDVDIVRASKELLRHTELLCVECDKPGKGFDADYQKLWEYVLHEVGFTYVRHKTKGNTLLSRP